MLTGDMPGDRPGDRPAAAGKGLPMLLSAYWLLRGPLVTWIGPMDVLRPMVPGPPMGRAPPPEECLARSIRFMVAWSKCMEVVRLGLLLPPQLDGPLGELPGRPPGPRSKLGLGELLALPGLGHSSVSMLRGEGPGGDVTEAAAAEDVGPPRSALAAAALVLGLLPAGEPPGEVPCVLGRLPMPMPTARTIRSHSGGELACCCCCWPWRDSEGLVRAVSRMDGIDGTKGMLGMAGRDCNSTYPSDEVSICSCNNTALPVQCIGRPCQTGTMSAGGATGTAPAGAQCAVTPVHRQAAAGHLVAGHPAEGALHLPLHPWRLHGAAQHALLLLLQPALHVLLHIWLLQDLHAPRCELMHGAMTAWHESNPCMGVCLRLSAEDTSCWHLHQVAHALRVHHWQQTETA